MGIISKLIKKKKKEKKIEKSRDEICILYEDKIRKLNNMRIKPYCKCKNPILYYVKKEKNYRDIFIEGDDDWRVKSNDSHISELVSETIYYSCANCGKEYTYEIDIDNTYRSKYTTNVEKYENKIPKRKDLKTNQYIYTPEEQKELNIKKIKKEKEYISKDLLKLIDLRISEFELYKDNKNLIYQKNNVQLSKLIDDLNSTYRFYYSNYKYYTVNYSRNTDSYDIKKFYEKEINNIRDNKSIVHIKEQIFKLINLIDDDYTRLEYLIKFKRISTDERHKPILKIYSILSNYNRYGYKYKNINSSESNDEFISVLIYEYSIYLKFYNRYKTIKNNIDKEKFLKLCIDEFSYTYNYFCTFNKNHIEHISDEQKENYKKNFLNIDDYFIYDITQKIIMEIMYTKYSISEMLEKIYIVEQIYYDVYSDQEYSESVFNKSVNCMLNYRSAENFISEFEKITLRFYLYSFFTEIDVFKEDKNEFKKEVGKIHKQVQEQLLTSYFTGQDSIDFVHPELMRLFGNLKTILYEGEDSYTLINNIYGEVKEIYISNKNYKEEIHNLIFEQYKNKEYLDSLGEKIFFPEHLYKINALINSIDEPEKIDFS